MSLVDDIAIYQQNIYPGAAIPRAYLELIKFVQKLRADFSKQQPNYKTGNISQGYMDITYFSFYDQVLRDDLLRFGIVLNHQEMRFELWLLAQNAEAQQRYWQEFKHLKWNQDKTEMPQYSVLEVVLVDDPDFTDLDDLAEEILSRAVELTVEIRGEIEL